MQSLPRDFLTEIARKYNLSREQEEAFVEQYSRDEEKEDDIAVAESLNISASTFRSRMTGVYDKFSIGGQGPGKFYRLWAFLNQALQQSDPLAAKQVQHRHIDQQVQSLREALHPLIQQRCGTMRVLNMTQPIGLGEIYTDVNILEKLTANRRLDIAELLEACRIQNSEDFDRFGLGRVTEKRVPGLEAVRRSKRLMVLGRPGAGKTTFLKYLAIQCIEGADFATQVSFFVTLKEFAEAEGQPSLLEYLEHLPLGQNISSLRDVLEAGRGLVLLDGLDEVQERDSSRVIRQIRGFAERFHTSQIVVTCRIAAKSYTFEQFTEVEVADFDEPQVRTFVQKWFQAKKPERAEKFLERLEENQPTKELANNPLLLTLLCLIFEDKGKFKANRSELYGEGLELLLERWDNSRDIERDQIYKKLSIRRKEDLLSKLALATFETGNYFFKRREAEEQIQTYIRNLPDSQANPDALEVDSKKVLRSIEAQHGLLTERAVDVYSFSHLTFHEYFTAREIKETNQLEILAKYVTDKRWREVFLLTIGMLRRADELAQLMKCQIDSLIATDLQLQNFLNWVNQKAQSVSVPYKSAAIRAFYFSDAFALACNSGLTRTRDREVVRHSIRSLGSHLTFILAHDLDLDLAHDLDHKRAHDLDLDRALVRNLACASVLDVYNLAHDLDLDCTHDLDLTPELQLMLQQLKEQLPNWNALQQWWKDNGQDWTEQLRAVMIKHCNIGHDWQLSNNQKKLLKQYYDANVFLVSCLNSDCYISREVREEIEATLLLPVSQQGIKNEE